MKNEFYSNGKLLLTGEYAILDGAKALALPTKFGQFLTIKNTASKTLDWVSLDEKGETWFCAKFSKVDLKIITTSDADVSSRLAQILREAKRLNPSFLSLTDTFNSIEAKLTFPRNWGLGSSSTLIANVAVWADVNPYQLLTATFGGSGYDIACARHNSPILYRSNRYKPMVRQVDFHPRFSDRLFFVYLNQKKNSRDAIEAYRNLDIDKKNLIARIDAVTERILNCTELSEFEILLSLHEHIISETLNIPTSKETLFNDYRGTIKSLGAWGGDFILTVGTTDAMGYFKEKGYSTILTYAEMIK
ncbi:GYDIA family GHMP kinase [Maribacter sp. X9]|uniref:GYDIA family GHMP kinase n=1 Tax=Maribacter sp. X9 TaxID=3402159 RepID=UPI003AF3666A